MFSKMPSKSLILAAIVTVSVVAASVASLSSIRKNNDPFTSLQEINAYILSNFGFSFEEKSSEYAPIGVVCNDRAPKNPKETASDQYTYCQNNGNPVKVSFAWKKAEMLPKDYLQLIANTVMKSARNASGNFVCTEDKLFPPYNFLSGILSDCTITTDDGKSYYYSAFFFSPALHPEISQVIYVYDSHENSNKDLTKRVTRNLAKGLVFESGEKRASFFSSLLVETVYASGGGGGGVVEAPQQVAVPVIAPAVPETPPLIAATIHAFRTMAAPAPVPAMPAATADKGALIATAPASVVRHPAFRAGMETPAILRMPADKETMGQSVATDVTQTLQIFRAGMGVRVRAATLAAAIMEGSAATDVMPALPSCALITVESA